MTAFRLVSEPHADLDIDGAFQWYEHERSGLGLEFLDALRATYGRIADGPLKYPDLRNGIRRALLRRFPYAVYFVIEGDFVVILAVLHVARDPSEWQLRRG